ncbi:MAG: amidohydrolase family protein [Erysipelotrichaceae bacterium]
MFDIHSHLGKTSSGEENTPTEMINELRSYGISKVGISCLSGISTRNQNDTIHQAMLEYPEQIMGYAFINPKDPMAMDEVDLCLGEYKMNGVKFHSWKHGYYPDNLPALDKLLDRIETYGVHVQTHVGTAPLSTPYVWAEYAKKHPNLRFVFTHIGYYEFGMSTILAIKDCPNVWVETSGQMEAEVLRNAVKILGSKRICFGTDWPYKPVNIEISKFEELGLSEAEKEDIFYKNAEQLWEIKK